MSELFIVNQGAEDLRAELYEASFVAWEIANEREEPFCAYADAFLEGVEYETTVFLKISVPFATETEYDAASDDAVMMYLAA